MKPRSRPRRSASTGTGGWSSAPSGTEPVIRVMAEGENQPFIEEIVDGIVDALSKAAA